MSTAEIIVRRIHSDTPVSQLELSSRLRQMYSEFSIEPLPKSTLIATYRQLLDQKALTENKALEHLLVKRAVRTLSGVTVITVLTKPFICPGKCVYCPTEPNMPKSYLSNEPAAQRAVRNTFDAINQVQGRIRALENNGHEVDKLELIVLGGTWSAYTKEYQEEFIRDLFYAANVYGENVMHNDVIRNTDAPLPITNYVLRQKLSLQEEQTINETARYRIIGLTLETRPDHIDEEEVKRLRYLGCTRVQLGVQHTDDKILELIRRGDTLANAIKATRLLKEAGFKVDHHYMPDLPGSTPAHDLEMFKYVYTSEDLQPDQVKIYPCVVNEYAQLWHWFKNGKYKPYAEKELYDLLMDIKRITPPYVRINRLIRDIPEESIIAGNSITNLRQYLQKQLAEQGEYCRCIRCREPRADSKDVLTAELKHRTYRASHGTEHFISFETPDEKTIYGFLRLRFNDQPEEVLLPELKGAALVRELHVYGQMTMVARDDSPVQHMGFGKKLMAEAERLSLENGYKKIAVISGIGVREYYKKLGYRLEGTYMVKDL